MTNNRRLLPMSKTRIIAIPLYPGLQSLDAVGPGQVFGTANQQCGREAYRVKFLAAKTGAVETTAGFALMADDIRTVNPKTVDTLIVPGGDDDGIHKAFTDKRLNAWIAATAKSARRACSVCSGAFLLAATGTLKGKRVATHWSATADLQRLFPDINVDGEAIYVNEGKYWTSAGITTGI